MNTGLSRRHLLLGSCALAVPPWAQATAAPAEVASSLPDVRLQGSGRLRFVGLSVYDARLWTASNFNPEQFARHPFALELQYQRALVGRLIAERSLKEMRQVASVSDAQAERWLAAMTQTFPDVKADDRITGLHREGTARFFFNGQPRGEGLAAFREPEFAPAFFGIWLSPRTSEPGLRRALIGA